jgi:hypothetical protein
MNERHSVVISDVGVAEGRMEEHPHDVDVVVRGGD